MAKLKPPQLDLGLFRELMRILIIIGSPNKLSTTRTDNINGTAKLLGISPYRLKKLIDPGPPISEWWWNEVLREAITEFKPRLKRKRKDVVNQALRKLPDEYFDKTESLDIARVFIIQQLASGAAHGQAVVSEGRSAGISEKKIRQAAQELGVKMVRREKGQHHYSEWRLPDWEEKM
jgi:signal recognition particle subunit SEC65